MAEKKSEFVVTDRRRFGTEGEPRPDAPVAEEEKAAAPPAPPKPTPPPPPPPIQQATPPAAAVQPPAGQAPQGPEDEELPAPPTAEEQHEQSEAYKASGRKIDEMISAAGKAPQGGPLEMTFERVIESF